MELLGHVVTFLAGLASVGAGVAFVLKERRQAWIPPALTGVWIASSFVAAVVYLALGDPVFTGVAAATCGLAIAATVRHEINRDRV